MKGAALAIALWVFSLPSQAEEPPVEDLTAEKLPKEKRTRFKGDLSKFS
jgi:hypothetical protein